MLVVNALHKIAKPKIVQEPEISTIFPFPNHTITDYIYSISLT